MADDVSDLLGPAPTKQDALPDLKSAPLAALPPEQSPATDEMSDLLGPALGKTTSTPQEKVGAFGQGVNRGIITGSPAAAGAFAGGAIGATAGAATGPLAPVAVPVLGFGGVIAGGIAGHMFGEAINEKLAKVTVPGLDQPLTFDNMASVPVDLRPWATAGDTFGQAVPFMVAPYTMTRDGIRWAGETASGIMGSIIDRARHMPLQFAIEEIGGALGSAMGAKVASDYFGVNPAARMSGELIGGLANPSRWIIAGASGALKVAQRAVSSLPQDTLDALEGVPGVGGVLKAGANKLVVQDEVAKASEAAKDKAASMVLAIIRKFGEDPQEIIKQLRANDALIGTLLETSGQKTGSPALLAIEEYLSKTNAKFGNDAETMGNDALVALKTTIEALKRTGNPDALMAAAKMRQTMFETLLNARHRAAEEDALSAAFFMNPAKIGDRTDLGVRTGEIFDQAIRQVRAVERELWAKVPQDEAAGASEILAQAAELADKRAAEGLPPLAQKWVSWLKAKQAAADGMALDEPSAWSDMRNAMGLDPNEGVPASITTGALLKFRSRMLELARSSDAQLDFADRALYGALAEAALRDLDNAGIAAPGSAMDEARAWSRQLHETFTQTYVGDALRKAEEGGLRLPPELIMRRAFGNVGEMGELNFRQMQEAMQMAGQEYVSRVLEVQRQTLQQAAGELISTESGRVKPETLKKWVEKNARLLDQFPDMKAALKDAETAERFLRSTEGKNAYARKQIAEQAAFSKVIQGEDPAQAVEAVFTGATPVRDLNALARFARAAGPEAEAGLKSSVFAWMFDRAGGTAAFSFSQYRKLLLNPPTPGGPSFGDALVNSGIMSKQDMAHMDAVLSRAAKFEDALRGSSLPGGIGGELGLIQGLVVKFASLAVAKAVPAQAGHSLAVAAAATRAGSQIFDKIPLNKAKDVIVEMSRSPKLMADMLDREMTPKLQLQHMRNMNAFLWSAGIGGWNDSD